jgi:hypothetical protein
MILDINAIPKQTIKDNNLMIKKSREKAMEYLKSHPQRN